jgi:hypothetical protein
MTAFCCVVKYMLHLNRSGTSASEEIHVIYALTCIY